MESFKEVFGLVSDYCKHEISSVAHDLWISCIEPVGFDGRVAKLYVRSEFQKNIIEQKYSALLNKAFEEVLGFPVTIQITCDEDKVDSEQAKKVLSTYTPEEVEKSAQGGDYEYTFSTFIVGPSNKFAHAASLAVAANPSGAYNPLFIYGGSGLGKTHLLYAICDEIQKNKPGTNIIYVKGEEFTNELIEAIWQQDHHRNSTTNTARPTCCWWTISSLSAARRAPRRSSSTPLRPSTHAGKTDCPDLRPAAQGDQNPGRAAAHPL